MTTRTVRVPAEVLEAIRPRVMACPCGRSPLGTLAVTVEACRCGLAPLNDAERRKCPRCGMRPGGRITADGVAPFLPDRVVWSTRAAR